jgi:hypothetical protein
MFTPCAYIQTYEQKRSASNPPKGKPRERATNSRASQPRHHVHPKGRRQRRPTPTAHTRSKMLRIYAAPPHKREMRAKKPQTHCAGAGSGFRIGRHAGGVERPILRTPLVASSCPHPAVPSTDTHAAVAINRHDNKKHVVGSTHLRAATSRRQRACTSPDTRCAQSTRPLVLWSLATREPPNSPSV